MGVYYLLAGGEGYKYGGGLQNPTPSDGGLQNPNLLRGGGGEIKIHFMCFMGRSLKKKKAQTPPFTNIFYSEKGEGHCL